jgi:hypothetical protein
LTLVLINAISRVLRFVQEQDDFTGIYATITVWFSRWRTELGKVGQMSEITVLAVSNRVKGSSQGSVEFSGGKGVVVQFSASYD